MTAEAIPGRRIIAIGGQDRLTFLQGLITNDIARLADGLVYAALLTPQGKYLADFFLLASGERVLLDVAEPLADGLLQRLAMYRLRADVSFESTDLAAHRGLGEPPVGAVDDPRHPALGWRLYARDAGSPQRTDWDAIRVEHCIPESGVELIPGKSYILECGFERLNGVDFHKGCYVGQEVTARMKHKTELKKGLVTVGIDGTAAPGVEILSDGKPAGTLHTRAGDRAIAFLRLDRAEGPMRAGDAWIIWPV